MSSQNDGVTVQNTTDLLKNATFAKPSAAPEAVPVNASELLLGAYDPARLHPLAGISDQVDYLMLEDDQLRDMPGSETAIPSRGWSDDLCYGTGTMYLGGMSFAIHVYASGLLAPPECLLLSSHLIVFATHHMSPSLLIHRSGPWRHMGSPRGL